MCLSARDRAPQQLLSPDNFGNIQASVDWMIVLFFNKWKMPPRSLLAGGIRSSDQRLMPSEPKGVPSSLYGKVPPSLCGIRSSDQRLMPSEPKGVPSSLYGIRSSSLFYIRSSGFWVKKRKLIFASHARHPFITPPIRAKKRYSSLRQSRHPGWAGILPISSRNNPWNSVRAGSI